MEILLAGLIGWILGQLNMAYLLNLTQQGPGAYPIWYIERSLLFSLIWVTGGVNAQSAGKSACQAMIQDIKSRTSLNAVPTLYIWLEVSASG